MRADNRVSMPLLAKILLAPLIAGLLMLWVLMEQESLAHAARTGASVTNLAVSERARLQRIIRLNQLLHQGEDEQIRNDLEREMQVFDQVLKGLDRLLRRPELLARKHSGPGAPASLLNSLQKCWVERLQPALQRQLQALRAESADIPGQVLERCRSLLDRLIQALHRQTEHSSSRLQDLIHFFFWLAVLIAAASLFYMHLLVVRPVHRLILATRAVTAGDFHLPVRLRRKDEIGLLAREFDHMRTIVHRYQQQLQRRAQHSEKRFEHLIEQLDAVIWEGTFGPEGLRFRFVSPQAERYTGLPPAAWLHEPGHMLERIDPQDREALFATLEELAAGISDHGQPRTRQIELRIEQTDSKSRFLHLSLHAEPTDRADTLALFGIFVDITPRRDLEARLHRLATRDPLTGLPNRTQLHERLRESLQEATAHARSVGLLYLDLDRFKLANDSLGHRLGDLLLRMAADRIRSCLRTTDLAARIGGDEFVILLPDIENRESTEKVACKLMESFRNPFVLEGDNGTAGEFFFTVSIGICLAPQDGLDAGQLLSQADAAMYQVKENGGNGYSFYTPTLIRKYERRLSLRNALHRALEEEQFLLHYQPQADLDTGRILGVEALLRWQHPEQGLVSPMEFIPALEDTGLILEVGKWVIETACRSMQAWQAEGPPDFHVAINLSGRQMQHLGLADEILDTLQRHQIPPQRLHVELTETLIMEHIDSGLSILHALSEAGITIELDDFGTGYSSLALLRRLPVNVLKIDRSFLEGVPGDSGNETIIRTIIDMAHTLEMRVLAEGVETLDQCRYLAALGCNAIQGFLISPPRPAPELLALLRQPPPLQGCPGAGSVF